MPISFHLDESVSIVIADALSIRGISVTTPNEVDLLSATDEEHLAFATRQGRVVVTHDHDFLKLHRSGALHAGIAYCASQTRTIPQIVHGLLLISQVLTPEQMRGRVEFL